MKKTIYTLIAATGLAGCENEVGEITFDVEPMIILNALLNSEDDTHHLQLRLSGQEETTELPDSDVELYINGELAATSTSNSQYYELAAHFEPGDEVELKVSNTTYNKTASATCTVPFAEQVVTTKSEDVEIDNMTYNREQITIRKRNNKVSYYRVTLDKDNTSIFYDEQLDHNYIGDFLTEDERMGMTYMMATLRTEHYFRYNQDIALMQGILMDDDADMSDYVDWISTTENKFKVFNSTYFSNNEYTLTLDVTTSKGTYPNYLTTNTFKIRSITETEYYYLIGACAAMDYEAGMLTSNAPVVTSNVKGGTGIFAISTPAIATIEHYNEYNLDRETFEEKRKKLIELGYYAKY